MLAKLDSALTKRAVVRLSGGDATDFLHAQFTSDVEALPAGRAQFTSWCTPKGRVIAVMLLARITDTDYILSMPGDISAAVTRRLTMFVLRADVTIDAVDEDVYGAWGDLASSIDLTPAQTTPESLECWRIGNATVIALANATGDVTRRLVIGNMDDVEKGLAPDAEADDWLEQEIRAGEPAVGLTLTEQFIPQSLNLDALGAVSFEKGCYPGQEIVARTFFLGRLKHRMAIGTASVTEMPAPGTRLFAAGAGDSAAGTVVSAARGGESGDTVLITAVVPIDEVSSELHLGSDDGEIVSFSTPPYKLPPNKRVKKDASTNA